MPYSPSNSVCHLTNATHQPSWKGIVKVVESAPGTEMYHIIKMYMTELTEMTAAQICLAFET